MHTVHTQNERVTTTEPEEIKASLESKPTTAYLRATALGFVTGIRSMLPLALLSWTSDKDQNRRRSPLLLLTSLAALGEMGADKLPMIPSRTSPGPFIGRLVIGGFGGLILCRRAHLSPIAGIVTGALGAGIGATASTYSRKWLSKTTGLPDPLWGGLEDIVALGLGLLAVQKKR